MRRKILDPAIASRLFYIRHKAGLTQSVLAARWKVSQTCIKTFEGGRVPHPTFLLLYADLGDVTVEWILTGKVDSRAIDRRISALDDRQRALIGEAIDLLYSGSKGVEARFKSLLELLEAAKNNLDSNSK